MRLNPAGREYAHFTVTGLPDAPANLEVSFNNSVNWYQCTWTGGFGTERTALLLVAGPDAVDNPDTTVILPLGRNTVRTRLADTPEVVIRDDVGVIDVTE